MAIAGDGFFEVQMPDGTQAYTRDGAFKLSSSGQVVTSDGLQVLGGFPTIPPDTTAVTVSQTGEISLTNATATTNAGRVNLTRFANPAGLDALGRNLFKDTLASGTPETGFPGENGFGQLQQGYLEMSNVKVVEEMVKLIMAQRAYEVNSKAIQAADEMMQQSNNLSR